MFILKLSPDESRIRIFTEGGMECIGYITDEVVHFNRVCTVDSDSLYSLYRLCNDYPFYLEQIKRDGRMTI